MGAHPADWMAARSKLAFPSEAAVIAGLDRFRDMLEDLGGGLGVTDPVSGEVLEMYDRSWLALWQRPVH